MGIFSKKTPKEKLQREYAKKLADAHKMSHSNRSAADQLLAEAEAIAQKIEALPE